MVKRQTPFLDHRRQLSGQREPSRGVVPVRGQNDPVVPPEADRLSGHTDRHRHRLLTPYQREHRISAVSAQGYRRLTAHPQMIPDLPGRCNGVTDTDDPPMFLAHQGIVDAQAAVGGTGRPLRCARSGTSNEPAHTVQSLGSRPASVSTASGRTPETRGPVRSRTPAFASWRSILTRLDSGSRAATACDIRATSRVGCL